MVLLTLAAAFAAGPVDLLDATLSPTQLDPGSTCPSCWDIRGTIEVDNIAYDKHVEVWFTADGYQWETLDAVYEAPSQGNRETWSFSMELGYVYPRRVQLAVRYEVAGAVYWDNNNGQDHVVTPLGVLPDRPVALVDAEKGIGSGCYGMCGDLDVTARVQDGGGTVWLYYRLDGGPIQRQQMQWSGEANPGYDYWNIYIPYFPTRDPVVELGLMLRTPQGRFLALDGGAPFVR